jgi:hypothetical protein
LKTKQTYGSDLVRVSEQVILKEFRSEEKKVVHGQERIDNDEEVENRS